MKKKVLVIVLCLSIGQLTFEKKQLDDALFILPKGLPLMESPDK
jgi:hypothetical protein